MLLLVEENFTVYEITTSHFGSPIGSATNRSL